MSTPDKQYVALAGKPTGEIILVDWRQPPGFNHRTVRADGDLALFTIELRDIIPPEGYQDALKVSGVVNANISAGEVHGGSEDVVDVNHSENILLRIQRAVPRGRYVATLKGGSRGIVLAIAEQVGHGKETDYDLGNWSDQSAKRTTLVSLSATTADKSAARVRVLHAHVPVLAASDRWKTSTWMKGWYQHVMAVAKKLKIA